MSHTFAKSTTGGSGGVVSLEDWGEIRRLHRAEGMGVTTIARKFGDRLAKLAS